MSTWIHVPDASTALALLDLVAPPIEPTQPSASTARVIDAMTDWIAEHREQALDAVDLLAGDPSVGDVASATSTLADIEREMIAFVEAMQRIGAGARGDRERIELDDALVGALSDLTGAILLVIALDDQGAEVVA